MTEASRHHMFMYDNINTKFGYLRDLINLIPYLNFPHSRLLPVGKKFMAVCTSFLQPRTSSLLL